VETKKGEAASFPKQQDPGKRRALGTAEMGHAAVSRSAAEQTQLWTFAVCLQLTSFRRSFMTLEASNQAPIRYCW
jgi:hypothetical protein